LATTCCLWPWAARCVTCTQKSGGFRPKDNEESFHPVYSPELSPDDVWLFSCAKKQMKDQVLTDEGDMEVSWQRSGPTLIEIPSIDVLRVKSQIRMHNGTQWRIFHQSTLTKRESHLWFWRVREGVITFVTPYTSRIFQALDVTALGVLKRHSRSELLFRDEKATVQFLMKAYHDFKRAPMESNT
jgi:hypothetical protein